MARKLLYETSGFYHGYEEFLGYGARGAGWGESAIYAGRHVVHNLPPVGTVGVLEGGVVVGGLGVYGLTRDRDSSDKTVAPEGSPK